LAGLTGVRSSSQKFGAVTGDGVVISHQSRCGLDKPPGFSSKVAMVKIASAKRTNDSSAGQSPGRAQPSLAARLDRLWKEFKSVCDAMDAAAAGGKPLAALNRKREKLRARSWALADQGESERLA